MHRIAYSILQAAVSHHRISQTLPRKAASMAPASASAASNTHFHQPQPQPPPMPMHAASSSNTSSLNRPPQQNASQDSSHHSEVRSKLQHTGGSNCRLHINNG